MITVRAKDDGQKSICETKMRILDVGSGDNPHPNATHLCDLHINSNKERGGNIVIDERPFIRCSIDCLPFRKSTFDFVYARHVLEHMINPPNALHEMVRIAKKGRIETPTYLAELVYGWGFHKWVISFRNGQIFFAQKPTPQKIINMHYLYKNNAAVRFIDKLVDFVFAWHYLRIAWRKEEHSIVFQRLLAMPKSAAKQGLI
jgi:ubiquinone/menaquinone biosynthesis C-methylase UbiE